jgi:isopenicillin N synthase-like dioxygenase
VRSLVDAARGFFGLPLEEKLKVKRSSENALGYNDGELTKNTRDWKEVFDFAVDGAYLLPGDGDEDGEAQIFPNRWPADMPEFR